MIVAVSLDSPVLSISLEIFVARLLRLVVNDTVGYPLLIRYLFMDADRLLAETCEFLLLE